MLFHSLFLFFSSNRKKKQIQAENTFISFDSAEAATGKGLTRQLVVRSETESGLRDSGKSFSWEEQVIAPLFDETLTMCQVLNHSSAILVQQPKIQQDGGSMSCKKPFTEI
ncbi:uncharacterized protein LOC133717995 [Rosa rugosa]|uniref:uncharacterized protein LOC133717995 n=1 Tax=Rosa rugosa TaxID=74645 RepID=UPI002B400BAD|nr:uncharacterized protein LOC133717995 [Rosa rugosa]